MKKLVMMFAVVLAFAALASDKDKEKEKVKSAESVSSGPRASDVVLELTEGNARFSSGVAKQRDVSAARSAVAQGQHPRAIILSCSDSRVPPELVFDETVGDLFVVRTAGNVTDSVSLASLEYAAEHLHSPVLVILGHERCGAVTAAASGAKMESPHLQGLVDEIAPGLATLKASLQGAELVHAGVEANVSAVAYEVVERSALLRKLVEEGHLTIARAIYDLDTGRVRWLTGATLPLAEAPVVTPTPAQAVAAPVIAPAKAPQARKPPRERDEGARPLR